MQNFEGKTIDRYQVIEPLGKGGMAIVYHAYDTRLERDVALKLIRTEAIPAEKHDTLITRFDREAKAMSRFSHPNIVPVHDYGEADGVPYLVMDYLPGGTLKKYTGNPIHYQNAAALLAPIADALAYAHSQNVIHRDVKPSNILITATNNVMLTDFGIAKALEDQDITLTGTGLGVGTPHYMAPEQWKNRITPSVDIYALGIIFYELVTGRRPYDAETPAAIAIQQATEPLERPTKYAPDLPDYVEKVIFKALAFQPENRFLSMDEFHTALQKIGRGQLSPVESLVADYPVRSGGLPTLDESVTIDKLAVPFDSIQSQTFDELYTKQDHKVPWGWIAFGGIALFGLLTFGVFQLIKGLLVGNPSASPTEVIAFEQEKHEEATDGISRAATATKEIRLTSTHISATFTLQPTATQSLGIGSSFIRDKDGMQVMYVPSGEFLMGSTSSDRLASENEFPQHSVSLDSFWIDRYEITNEMFGIFVSETGYVTQAEKNGYSYIRSGEGWIAQDGTYWQSPLGLGSTAVSNLPVVHVNQYDAAAYCQWVDGRLPTEEEWEMAARGTDGNIYPWGDDSPNGSLLNMADQMINLSWSESFNDGYSELAPVGSYPLGASPFGLEDVAGNVWEITDSCYSQDYSSSRSCNYYVLKGGSFSASLRHTRPAGRKTFMPENTHGNVGFRCVMDGN